MSGSPIFLQTAIVIPAYNAGATLGKLLEQTSSFIAKDHIIVVDDGSTDGTFDATTSRNVHCIRHPKNLGKGAALRTGFNAVLEIANIDHVMTIDADLQHDPASIPQFVAARLQRNYNIVIGKRAMRGTTMPFERRLSNNLTSFLVSAKSGMNIEDSQCGYRLIGMEVLRAVKTERSGYEAETEFLIKAARLGFTIGSVPIETRYGKEKSYMTHWKTTVNFLKVLLKEYK
jgi:glycosyltransferase involved in cell wall biosynthesis